MALVIVLCGCTADLKRIHTPDLLSVEDFPATPAGFVEPMSWGSDLVLERSSWKCYSSLAGGQRMIDDLPETAAVAPNPESKDQYLLIDLGRIHSVAAVHQVHFPPEGYPRKYRIDVAGDHNFPYHLQFVGNGTPGKSRAIFPKPVSCRFLRITLLETSSQPWNIAEIDVEEKDDE